jgi:hypothetical protein
MKTKDRVEIINDLRNRSGIKGLRYATESKGVDYAAVRISIEDFERLLSDAEESRARRDTV